MTKILEVIYRAPVDSCRESRIVSTSQHYGGEVTYREEPTSTSVVQSICLTIEFAELADAGLAATELRSQGEHVGGPVDYGDNERGGPG